MFLASMFLSLAVSTAVAVEPPSDPSYEECFELAQKAVQADVVGLQMEADAVGAQGIATPATLPPAASAAVTLPGLDGAGDFEQALKEQGVRITIDPEDPTAAPVVEMDNVRIEDGQAKPLIQAMAPSAPSEVQENETTQSAPDAPEAELSAAEVYQQKRTLCRIKFGINF